MINQEQKLFEEMSALAASMGASPQVVWGACINLLVNAIRQTTGERKAAEDILNKLLANIRVILLDVHYDPATGKRREVFPFTQTVQAPFHEEPNNIHPPRLR